MSQSEDPKLQEGKDKHCARVETQQSNAPPLLRSLAPKLAPRLPPFTIRAKSEASTTSSRGQQAARLGRTRDERCAVCFSRSCKLVSHKLHDASQKLRQHGTHQPPKRLGRDRVYSSSYSLKLAACYIFAGPRASRLDPFHSLPIPEDLDATHMQRLFHDWFVVRAPRHFTVPRPREIVSDLLHSPFLAPSFSDSVLCLGILTVSAASQTDDTTSHASNVLALTLLDRTMSMLRARVTSNKTFVTDTTIVGAIYIWAANLYIADDNSLRQHANSVRALVEARDGLSSLGMSGAVANLFKWVDIMSSLRLNQRCHEPDARLLSISLSPELRHGVYWTREQRTSPLIDDESVISACRSCCAAIVLLEVTEGGHMEPATYWYLYQRIAQLYQDSSTARAKFINTGTIKECVVLAMDIMKLIVFNGGQTRPGRRSLRHQANFLVTAIKATGGSNFWQEHIEMLIWLIIIACVAEPGPEHRAWCARVLKGATEFKFGSSAQNSNYYVSGLQALLSQFGWPALPPFDDLRKICERAWS